MGITVHIEVRSCTATDYKYGLDDFCFR